MLSVGPREAAAAPLLAAKNGTKFDGFRIAFEVEKTSESAPNPAKISIYNLRPESRANFEDPNLTCLLDVGYAGIGDGDALTSLLFVGDVRRTYTHRQGPDLITTIEAGDAEVALRTAHIETSFGEFTSPSAVISALAKKLGVTVGTIVPSVAAFFQHGISLTGLVSDNLDNLTKQSGLEWNVTDGELNVLDPSLPTPELAVLVSKDSGLIGFPSKRINGFIDFTTLINPALKPGRAISLVSETISGSFKFRTGKYRGDTMSGPWECQVEAF